MSAAGEGSSRVGRVVVPPSSLSWELLIRIGRPVTECLQIGGQKVGGVSTAGFVLLSKSRRGRQGSYYHQSQLGLCLGFAFQELREVSVVSHHLDGGKC